MSKFQGYIIILLLYSVFIFLIISAGKELKSQKMTREVIEKVIVERCE